jgi:hypothetical protein
MYDKENKHLSKFVLAKMTTLTQFQKHFDTIFRTANAKKPARHMLVVKFKSAFSLYEIKNQEFVQKFLNEFNIYLRDHSFEYVLVVRNILRGQCRSCPGQGICGVYR